MAAATKFLNWDGHDLPEVFRNLPPGRYLIEPVEEWSLTPQQESELEEAIAAMDRGEFIPGEEAAETLRRQIEGSELSALRTGGPRSGRYERI